MSSYFSQPGLQKTVVAAVVLGVVLWGVTWYHATATEPDSTASNTDMRSQQVDCAQVLAATITLIGVNWSSSNDRIDDLFSALPATKACISEAEAKGDAVAVLWRETVQEVIGQYMIDENRHHTGITYLLEDFSRDLTESLIFTAATPHKTTYTALVTS